MPNQSRPDIFSFTSASSFVKEMLAWCAKTDKGFSVKRLLAGSGQCSAALVSRVARGERRLTRDKVGAFAALLGLTPQETQYLDRLASQNGDVPAPIAGSIGAWPPKATDTAPPLPSNHLFADWVNVYVKDACGLRGLKPDPHVLHEALGGLASIKQIGRSLDFLLREGFLRRTIDGEIVLNEAWTCTSDDTPDHRVRVFHKKALDIARDGLDKFGLDERRSETMLFAVNKSHVPLLHALLKHCMDQVMAFSERHAADDERLYQVTLHLTPITGDHT